VARFARYVHAEDARHELPPHDFFARPRHRPVPYIFAPRDVQRLVAEARLLKPVGGLRPLVLSSLFALLAATGLRLREALRLRLDDVTPDGLVIRQTKFRKSRLAPLHPTAVAGLERYLERRRALGGQDDHVFLNRHGRALSGESARDAFLQVRSRLDLVRGPDQPQPHLQSLRHTFAVRALERCPHERGAVGRHILALVTYLGHASVAETYWYLEATPELLTDIARACEAHLKELAPCPPLPRT
jgi:integrase